jgi:hypothetical protein
MRRTRTALSLALFVSGLSLLDGCYTPVFSAASSPKTFTGTGGVSHSFDGVEVWTFGSPERPFQIIGWLYDERQTGAISTNTFELNIAEAAKKAGGDGVILLRSDTQLRYYNYNSLAVFRYLPVPENR